MSLDQRGWTLLRVLINRFHSGGVPALQGFLPDDEAQALASTDVSSDDVASRVAGARRTQAERGDLNRDLDRRALDALPWSSAASALLSSSARRLAVTARGWDRVRRVARTVADLEGSTEVGEAHMAEALASRGQG